MSSPLYVGHVAASVATSVANLVVNKADLETDMGRSLVAGDVLVAVPKANSTVASWTSTGFSVPFADNSSASSAVLTRTVDGSEGSTFTFTRSQTTAGAEVELICYSGAALTGAIEAAGFVPGSGGSLVLPTITTLGPDRLIGQSCCRMIGTATWTPPGTATERYDAATSTNNLAAAYGDETKAAAGAVGTRTWAQSSTGATRGIIFAVVPGVTSQTAAATLASTSTLSVTPEVQHPATVGFASTSTLLATTGSVQSATVGMASTSDLSITPAVQRVGAVALSSTATLSVTAVAQRPATVTLASSSALAALATRPNSEILAGFYASVAARETDRVNIGILGASLVEGYPCTADKTIAQYLAERFRGSYPTSGDPHGYGYIGLPSAAMIGINPWSITPGTGGDVGTSNATNGWGGHHQAWFTNGSLAVPPILELDLTDLVGLGAWTSFDIDLLRVSTYSTTAGRYRLDGGAWVNFSLQATGGSAETAKLHVASPPTGTLEISIATGNAASFVIVNGITAYSGDESKGFGVHDFGHSGYKVSQWRVSTQPGWDFRYDQFQEALDLLILQDLGVNDAQSISSAQFRTDLFDFIDYLRAVHTTVPMVMVAVQDLSASVTFVEPWPNYVAVLREAAAAYDMAWVDYSGVIPEPPGALYYTDEIHGATDGSMYSLMADTLFAALAPPAAEVTATVSMAGSSTLGISGQKTIPSAVTLAGSSSLAATGRQTVSATSTLAGTSSLSVAAAVQRTATVSFTGTGSLVVTGRKNVLATVPMASTSTLAVTGSKTVSPTVAMTGSSALAVTSRVQVTSAALLAGTGALTVTGRQSIPAALTLAGAGTLSITVQGQQLGSAALAGSGTLSVTGQQTISSTVLLAGNGTLFTGTAFEHPAAVQLAGDGSLVVTGEISHAEAVSMTGAGTLTGSASAVIPAPVELAGRSDLTVTGGVAITPTVGLAGSSDLTVVGDALRLVSGLLAGDGTLDLGGNLQTPATATFAGLGALLVAAIRAATSGVDLNGAGDLMVVGEDKPVTTRDITVTGRLLASTWSGALAAARRSGALQPSHWTGHLEET